MSLVEEWVVSLNLEARRNDVDLTALLDSFNDVSIIEGRGLKCVTVTMGRETREQLLEAHGDKISVESSVSLKIDI